jgi:heme/copper-type cytochrome/quinol oxidase subunit 2
MKLILAIILPLQDTSTTYVGVLLLLYDSPLAYRLGFQDSASIMASGIVFMHDKILYYLINVLFLVLWLIVSLLTNFYTASNYNGKIIRTLYVKGSIHGKVIELVWTITPAIILLLIAIPSYKLL